MSEIPADRLVLRPIGPEAARAVLEGRHPEGLTLAPGYPSPFSLEVMEMVATAGPDAATGGGPWFMVRRDDGAVVGEIGATVDGSTAQVGYTVVEPSWGQGYATEALRALLGRLLADPGIERVVAETLEDHAASRRVMEKAGMRLRHRRVGEVDGEQAALVVYELPADPSGPGPALTPTPE